MLMLACVHHWFLAIDTSTTGGNVLGGTVMTTALPSPTPSTPVGILVLNVPLLEA